MQFKSARAIYAKQANADLGGITEANTAPGNDEDIVCFQFLLDRISIAQRGLDFRLNLLGGWDFLPG